MSKENGENDWDNYSELMDEVRKNGDSSSEDGRWTRHRDSEWGHYWSWTPNERVEHDYDDDRDGPDSWED